MTQGKPQSRGLARRQAMLDAATELFLEQGFERTSLSDIVSRSKGSRSTLYEQFGNKEGLLRAMVEEVTADIWTVIGDNGDSSSLEDGLVDLGLRIANAALAPRAIAAFRVLTAEGWRQPEIAELFFERGPHTAERLLADRFLHALHTQNASGTPEQLSRVFLGAVLGVFHSYRVLGLPPAQNGTDIEAHIRLAVRIFLNGVGRQDAKKNSQDGVS